MWYALLLAACIAGDQLLKYWVVRHLEIGQSAAFLPGLVRLTRLHNTGAAWGSFSGSTALLTAVTAVLLVAVAWLVLKKVIRHPLGLCAAMLVLGGGIGNMIDRIALGYVVDFVDFTLIHFAVFNVADSFVSVGAVMLVIYFVRAMILDYRNGKQKKSGEAPESRDGES